ANADLRFCGHFWVDLISGERSRIAFVLFPDFVE
ncbi:unnamed protein product, partial [Arabidopsis halleri]